MNEDKATRYNRLKRRADAASLVWSVVFLGGLVLTGGSIALRDAAHRLGGGTAPASPNATSVAVFTMLLIVLSEIGSLPLAFYGGFVLEHRYGLSRQPLRTWLVDRLKSLALLVLMGCPAAAALYVLIGRFALWWWMPAGAVFALLAVGLAGLAPVLLLPLFYRVQPVTRQPLRARLLALAQRAGAPVLDVYEWGLGEKTRKANAALAGFGATRRILVSDTMLAEYSDDEIEVVMAHELGHHVHGDIWTGLAFEAGLILVGFLVASWALRAAVVPVGLAGVGDVAGLPVLLLAAGAVSLLAVPAAHALSRAHERRADRFALTLTGNGSAFASAMRRLAAQNMAEAEPSPIVRWLFHSHPSMRERIEAARPFGA
ncbi:MAG: M48 family metallopeptidase [Vicinamibacterales bacterium]